MGKLKVGVLDFNNFGIVNDLLSAIEQMTCNETSYFSLKFKPSYYFQILDGPIPQERGWYIILDGTRPLYVGQADDLNYRLNTNHGSTDNYGRTSRSSDDKRNFIKKFDELGVFNRLRVCIIPESKLCTLLAIDSSKLTKLDRDNVEKIVDIHRGYFHYLS